MAFQPCEGAEPVPGYTLLVRLGIGGYGEVWKVSAPGGLNKAMKFVYGRMEDDRGARELKALGRIKEVRHPFLLSLERFDVIDGQLFIVTELAEMSLMDRFRECREAGMVGIPRDELLGFLRDAADALDYMSDKFGLQHLDIKPENLLLVGSRVKVADFGLCKDLQDANNTLVGGVTPLYATPEAFDGRASRSSDQYSLAIVYQEMLTGALPFPGFTTAQLAVQHMHSPPSLGPLPDHDRPTIARALSKQPDRRFASCREMIDFLLRCAEPHPAEMGPPATHLAPPESNERRTFDLRSTPCHSGTNDTSLLTAHDRVDGEAAGITDAELEPLAYSGDRLGTRPTLFLGLGGTASLVLRKLRRRLCERVGSMQSVPCWQMLLLDTEPNSSRGTANDPVDEALSPDEALFLPLRRPADYHAASEKLLGWLSRRWLYNIPRSLRTEGLRPLGRLVYVDHAERIADRIRRALTDITSDEAKMKSAETTGARLRDDAPRVFIISSICGGTGGGMLFDIAYAVREVLAELGLAADGVCGVLTHGTMKRGTAKDLRKVNAYATLTEWNHYSARGGACPVNRSSTDSTANGARTAPAANAEGRRSTAAAGVDVRAEPPFGDSYLVELGDDLSEAEFDAAAANIARYLYLDAATPCGAALDRCRELTRERPGGIGGAARLRTFGLHMIGCDKFTAAGTQAELLCQRVVGRWHGDGRPTDPAGLHLDTAELALDPLSKRLFAVADKALGGKAEVHFRGLLAQPLGIVSAGSDALARIDVVLGAPHSSERQQDAEPTRFTTALREATTKLAGAVGESIVRAAAGLVEDPHGRLPAALAATSLFQEHMRSLRQEAEDLFRKTLAETTSLRAVLVRGDGDGRGRRWRDLWGETSPQETETRLLEYCDKRLRTLVYQQVVTLVQSAIGALGALNERLLRLRSRCEQFGRDFAVAPADSTGGQTAAAVSHLKIVEAVAQAELADPTFAARFDERLQRECLEPNGGLLALGAAGDEAWKSLRDELRSRSRAALLASLRDIDAARLLIDRHPDVARQTQELAAAVEKAVPRLSRLGGAKRVLAVLPDGAYGKELAATALGNLPKVALTLFDADSDLVLCQEAEELSLAKVAVALIDNRPDYAAAARRLLTRVDIRWASLPSVREPCDQQSSVGAMEKVECKTQNLTLETMSPAGH
ncbi:MAG TPA: tubulin-like doman-containing protein [Pirellulales bacterium]|nr:tubulin-like doman-containing protein [Pirellulales bacterium]